MTLEELIEIKKQGIKLKDADLVKEYFDAKVEELIGGVVMPYRGRIVMAIDLFNTQPASTKWHQAYEGGLKEHCFMVYVNLLERMCNQNAMPLTISIEQATKIAICHDFCKLALYYKNEQGEYEYDSKMVKHHATLSIDICNFLKIDLDVAEKCCIRHHMNSFDLKEDYEQETIEEIEWRSDSQNELTLRAVNWADMKE